MSISAAASHVLPLALLLLAGCDSTDIAGPLAPVDGGVRVESLAELAAIRVAWDGGGPRSYRLGYERICFCGGDLSGVVTVRDGVVAAPAPQSPETVEGLFDLAAVSLADTSLASVEVRVSNRAPRIPVRVSVDYAREVADDEIAIVVTGFGLD